MAAAYDSPDSTLPRVHAWLQAATLLFGHSTWVDLERRWVPALRDRGAVNTLIPVLFALGYNALRDGRLSAAEADLAEGRSLSFTRKMLSKPPCAAAGPRWDRPPSMTSLRWR
jgi:hypothetical protein